jgi:hypothetical protein
MMPEGPKQVDMETHNLIWTPRTMQTVRLTRASKASPSPEPCMRHRATGIISASPDDELLEVNADAHIIINNDGSSIIGRDGVGIEDGIIMKRSTF